MFTLNSFHAHLRQQYVLTWHCGSQVVGICVGSGKVRMSGTGHTSAIRVYTHSETAAKTTCQLICKCLSSCLYSLIAFAVQMRTHLLSFIWPNFMNSVGYSHTTIMLHHYVGLSVKTGPLPFTGKCFCSLVVWSFSPIVENLSLALDCAVDFNGANLKLWN